MEWKITDKLIQFIAIVGGLVSVLLLAFWDILDSAAAVTIVTLVITSAFAERQNGNLKKENKALKEEIKNGS